MWLWAALAGALCVLTRLLPLDEAVEVTVRVAPVMLFLIAITVVAELADNAEVFELAAVEAARLGGGHRRRLYVLVLGLGTGTTVALSLDTTAVLLTPVVLSLAFQLELPPRPFAMAAVWLANTASLLLPISNLTNLLAMDRLGLSVVGFAARMWLPAIAALAVTYAVLLVTYRRELRGSYVVPARRAPRDWVLFAVSGLICVLMLPAFGAGLPVWAVASGGALVLILAYAARARHSLRFTLIPWRLVLLVEGLFLTIDTLHRFGLPELLGHLAGQADGPLGLLRTAGTAAMLANVANNLPAYYAMEEVAGAAEDQVLAVLLGANVGPLILVWGSLATLLWQQRCRARGVHVPAGHFAAVGAVGVPLLILATTGALLLTT